MQQADLTTRAVAGFVDLLLVIALARLPDVLGYLSATGYLLFRDGLFDRRSIGKRLMGLRVASAENTGLAVTFRESIIRNVPFAAAYLLFLVPFAGWILGILTVGVECLTALGDEREMRIGDLLARTVVVQDSPSTVPTSPDRDAGEPPVSGDAPTPQDQQPPE